MPYAVYSIRERSHKTACEYKESSEEEFSVNEAVQLSSYCVFFSSPSTAAVGLMQVKRGREGLVQGTRVGGT